MEEATSPRQVPKAITEHGRRHQFTLAMMGHGEETETWQPTQLSNGMPNLESELEANTMGETKGRHGCFSIW